ncbi:MAG: hypothetical protein ACP5HS_14840 [Anaerolineae bacterium]
MNREENVKTLGESENYAIWVSNETDLDEVIYHIEFQNVTIHLFEDEWEEFVSVVLQSVR